MELVGGGRGWPVGVWAVGIGVGALELVGRGLCCREGGWCFRVGRSVFGVAGS